MRSTTRCIALAIGLLVLVRPQLAAAKPKVALVAFEGDHRNAAREMVADAMGDDVEVIGSKQVNRTIDDLGLDTTALDDHDLRKLAKELEVDAIIQAKLSTKGRVKTLHFKLFVHGKKVKGFKAEFGSLKSARFKEKLHDKLLEKLGFTEPPAGDDDTAPKDKQGGDDDDATPPSTTTKKVPIGDETDADALKTKHDGDDDGGKKPPPADDAAHHPKVAHAGDDDDSTSVSAHVEVHPAATGARTANRAAVRLDFGPSGSQRSLTFNSRVFPQAPNGYSNTFVPGFRVDGEIYPFAFGNPDSIVAGIGLGGIFDQTELLSLTTSVQPGTRFPVTQRRYSVGPRFRILFGHSETSPSLVIGVGYGHRSFIVDRSALMPGNLIDLPDVDYHGYDPNIQFRIPLTPRFALTFGGGAIFVTDAGQIQTAEQYGQARITAGEGNIGLDILITRLIGVTLVADAAQLGYKFTGNGAMTNSRDGDPSSPDVGGAADRYLGAAGMFTVLY